ncbi:hypothetical protein PTTG_08021 [Puccinia triticina 1-1 BBBD Race 1]|uniref:Uncharacterized protein n=1 Tax=Puccinia triticina (isolate 1-1 / race 1 (BBBD)) TaxID=630390 RepID=A0A180GKL5_PUCT1|nr:hypothetical protein PTTG_08021 [Puccinia triticina 1-1 BBBD Race 1]
MDAVAATCTDIPILRVLKSAEAAGDLQWRGYCVWPGGPPPRNIDVTQDFIAFAELASTAVPLMKVWLNLYMDLPLREELQPNLHFVPSGALPPREDCFVLGDQKQSSRASSVVSSTQDSNEGAPSFHSSSARDSTPENINSSSAVDAGENVNDSALGVEGSSMEKPGAGTATPTPSSKTNGDSGSPAPPNGKVNQPDLPDIVMLDGPPSSWVSNSAADGDSGTPAPAEGKPNKTDVADVVLLDGPPSSWDSIKAHDKKRACNSFLIRSKRVASTSFASKTHATSSTSSTMGLNRLITVASTSTLSKRVATSSTAAKHPTSGPILPTTLSAGLLQ